MTIIDFLKKIKKLQCFVRVESDVKKIDNLMSQGFGTIVIKNPQGILNQLMKITVFGTESVLYLMKG